MRKANLKLACKRNKKFITLAKILYNRIHMLKKKMYKFYNGSNRKF